MVVKLKFIILFLFVAVLAPYLLAEKTGPLISVSTQSSDEAIQLIRNKKGRYMGNEIAPCEVKIVYTEEQIIFRFKMPVAGPLSAQNKRDFSYWKDQSVEIFIATPEELKNYRHYVLAPSGGIYDAIGFDSKWNGNIKTHAYKSDKFWFLEARLPADDIGLKSFTAGQELRANFAWNAGDSGRLFYWSPAPEGLHDPKSFGSINLTEKIFAAIDIERAVDSDKKTFTSVELKTVASAPASLQKIGYSKASYNKAEACVNKTLVANETLVQFQLIDSKGNVICRTPLTMFLPYRSVSAIVLTPYILPGLDGAAEVNFSPEAIKLNPKVSWILKNSSGKAAADGCLDNVKLRNIITVPMKSLPADTYRLVLTSKGLDRPYTEEVIIKKVDSSVSFTEEKFVKLNNQKPFFPIGMWMPWPELDNGVVPSLSSPEQITKDLPEILQAGFNCVMIPEAKHSLADKAYDKAEKLGLYVMYMGQYPEKRFDRYKNIFAWAMYDEPSGFADLTPEYLRKSYTAEKKKYPDMPVLVNHMKVKPLRDYSGSRDILSMDPYAFGRDVNLRAIPTYVRAMKRYCDSTMPCWAVLQFFKMNDVYYLPSPQQMRCQTYLALLMGLDGIFYFTTVTPEKPACHLLTDSKASSTWKYMKKLVKDVKNDLPIFKSEEIASSQPGSDTETKGIYWKRYRAKNGVEFLVIVNIQKTPIVPVFDEALRTKFEIPQSIPGYGVKIIKGV